MVVMMVWICELDDGGDDDYEEDDGGGDDDDDDDDADLEWCVVVVVVVVGGDDDDDDGGAGDGCYETGGIGIFDAGFSFVAKHHLIQLELQLTLSVVFPLCALVSLVAEIAFSVTLNQNTQQELQSYWLDVGKHSFRSSQFLNILYIGLSNSIGILINL
ncbi:predicted protein [Lodderomyces elongisporus NRRL YB-4239]|uniref:Uncharacterized protein n=1 Tax=Lodderomyces elongisporus (strain ATCC 11503 / CBS 2605 / JCM 1781 / NBRC 1676 / NRRL YB-4239) TaxID=379508 RepID=A5DTS4_LODEL|nr:predicted protein [Lodderomyces elongisporus NRRL YB-4239]